MSWSIKSIGTRENVKAEVLADKHVPETVKAAIVSVIDAGNKSAEGDSYSDGVRVETFGHYGPDQSWSSIGKLEVEPVTLAKAPVAAV